MKKFYPVIHCESFYQVRKNLDILKNYDKDGVFLINHGDMTDEQFYRLVEFVVFQYQNSHFEVGVNLLKLSAIRNTYANLELNCKIIQGFGVKNLWIDNAGVDKNYSHTSDFYYFLKERNPNIKLFGGVHFKYQPKPELSIEESLQKLYEFWPNSVPTLSGEATGKEADLELIKKAKVFVDSKTNLGGPERTHIAIASGINKDNIAKYIPYADCFLVASSLLKEGTNDFDSQKLSDFEIKFNEGYYKWKDKLMIERNQ